MNLFSKALSFLVILPPILTSQTVNDFSSLIMGGKNIKSITEDRYFVKENFSIIQTDEIFYSLKTSFYLSGEIEDLLFIGKSDKLFRFKFSSSGNLTEFYEGYDKYDKLFNYFYKYEYSNTDELVVAKRYEYENSDEKFKLNPDYSYGNYILLEKIVIHLNKNKNCEDINYLLNHNSRYSNSNIHLFSYPKIYAFSAYSEAIAEINNYTLENRSDLSDNIVSKERRISIGIDKYKSEIIKEFYELKIGTSYKYDQMGNWISCTYYFNETPVILVNRDIQYY